MVQDVSKATIMILLILTIIVSILSTVIILDRAEQLKSSSAVSVPQKGNKGYVTMTITGTPEPASTTGRVSMKIAE